MKLRAKSADYFTPQWATGSNLHAVPTATAIDIWLFDLDKDSTSLVETLDDEERSRASRFVFPVDARRYAAAHGYLRTVLANYLQCPPASITFERGRWGKPALPAAIAKSLSFNLAHSGGLALLAVGLSGSLGVDLELARPFANWREVAVSAFAPGEITSLDTQSEDVQLDGFFATWTRKEAIVKMWGQGLSADLKAFEVPTNPHCSNELLKLAQHGRTSESVRLWTFKPARDFWAALAAPLSTDVELRFWRHN
jgi:4'-phosphopantetheinyl transferase